MGRVGSSPRARGTPHRDRADGAAGRIIPACARNTRSSGARSISTSDHPRVRGEHATERPRTSITTGSSPRARGTRPRRASPRPRWRIIPACAGNTSIALPPATVPPDHPRVRGEHLARLERVAQQYGSSPRARGTRGARAERSVRCRIIPACAGNTVPARRASGRRSDHPRVRGEHCRVHTRHVDAAGSSPRARGTRTE